VDVLALDEALSAIDSRQCRVVELRFFAGLTIDKAVTALGISPATVEREWVALTGSPGQGFLSLSI
jgi:RNA polymerase sigma-70 factor (ECF subfamily)